MPNSNLDVFVVGAGVSGLTTAIRALEAGYSVIIFAEVFPGDPKSIKYASFWAGANHSTFASYPKAMHQLDQETIPIVRKLIEEDPSVPVMTGTVKVYSETTETYHQFKHQAEFYSKHWWFRHFDESDLPAGVVHGGEYPTLYFDVPRTTISSLSSLISTTDRSSFESFPADSTNIAPSSIPAAIINCTGLGSLVLGDVMDTNMYPTRGETLLLRAPWVGDEGTTYSFQNSDVTYVIPRQSGDVIVGGTWQENDWHPTSRPETVKAIKERAVRVFPALLPEATRANRDINDLDVIEECVGLRPSRKGGVRIESTSLEIGGKAIPIVHNYGHGGAGYQESWPSANRAIELLKASLAA